jgi:hypothetical protein
MINIAAVAVLAMLLQSGAMQDIAALKARAESGDTKSQVRLGLLTRPATGLQRMKLKPCSDSPGKKYRQQDGSK